MTTHDTRMLTIEPASRSVGESRISELPRFFDSGDVLVINDAATLPASMHGVTERGEPIEVRLLEAPFAAETRAVLFGAGDHRTPTEHRPAPPRVERGDVLILGSLRLRVRRVSPRSPRLLELSWPGDAAERFRAVYAEGKPVQYSYIEDPLALWDVQTAFASRPWAVEMPSAARPLRVDTLRALRKRGVEIAWLTHAAGLSSTGDPVIDDMLPMPERYEIPHDTARVVEAAQRDGRRIVAVGTSVVRALEDSALRAGRPTAGVAEARLVLDETTPRRVVSGLLTGVHVPGESHYRLLRAFADEETLSRGVAIARERGYRQHELGDACLVLDRPRAFRTSCDGSSVVVARPDEETEKPRNHARDERADHRRAQTADREPAYEIGR